DISEWLLRRHTTVPPTEGSPVHLQSARVIAARSHAFITVIVRHPRLAESPALDSTAFGNRTGMSPPSGDTALRGRNESDVWPSSGSPGAIAGYTTSRWVCPTRSVSSTRRRPRAGLPPASWAAAALAPVTASQQRDHPAPNEHCHPELHGPFLANSSVYRTMMQGERLGVPQLPGSCALGWKMFVFTHAGSAKGLVSAKVARKAASFRGDTTAISPRACIVTVNAIETLKAASHWASFFLKLLLKKPSLIFAARSICPLRIS